MVGRGNELKALESALAEAAEGKGSTVLISGEAGLGKTTLVREFILKAAGATLLMGSAPADAVQPFHIFNKALAGAAKKPIFEDHEYRTFTELFVIDRSGILLAKAAPEQEGLDADIFAGMFSAVQDFVRDSFDRGGGQKGALGRLEYGNMKLLVEHGQKVFLVAVFDGAEHPDMRVRMRNNVRDIEDKFGSMLDGWSGNTRELRGIQMELETLALSRFLVRKSLEGVSLSQERTRIADEALGMIEGMAENRAVLILLEDIHWADESSIFVLNYLARNIRKDRIMMVGTLRPGEGKVAMDGLAQAIGDSAISVMNLGGLNADSTASLVEGLYPNHRFPGQFIRKMIAQCEGNPFFATELLRELEASGSIVRSEGVYVLEEQGLALPSSIEEVVHKRIENLDSDTLAVVEFASCIGREFDRNILTRLRPSEGVDEALGTLAESGIIVNAGGAGQFSHAMFQSVIYKGLSGRWKSHYHKSIGEHYEETFRNSPDAVIYELARHFSMTSEHQKTFEYCRKAGEKAEGSYSPDLAAEYYQKSIAVIPKLKMGTAAASERVELLERIGEIQSLRGMFEDSLEHFEKAIGEAPDPVTKAKLHRKRANVLTWHGKFDVALKELDTAESLLEGREHDERGFLLIARSFINLNTGKFDDTLKLSREGIKVLEGTADPEAKKVAGRAWKIMGACNMLMGNHAEALRCHGMGRKIGEELNDIYGLGAAYNNIGNVYLNMGDFAKALEHYNITMELMEKTKDLQGMSYVLNNIGIIHKNRGDFGKALENYRECVRVLEKIGDPSGVASALNNIGNLQGEQEEFPAAIASYEKALEIAGKIGDKQQVLSNLCALVPSLVGIGDVVRAEKECLRAIDMAREIGSKQLELMSLRSMGMVEAMKGNCAAAENHFLESEKGFSAMSMNTEIAKTFMEHGAMLLKSGRKQEGRKMLEEASGIFRKAGSDWFAGRCEKLLAE
jgi:tetratricopeptide (TPR) repeat protein